ncbi:MAG: hypothetical protein ABI212_13840 [Burkholderiaceae bacterium]
MLRNGYTHLRTIEGRFCGLHVYLMTVGLVVGLDARTYERRCCFEHAEDALGALADWDGRDHPAGPWIKCKGSGVDLLNPTRIA